MNPLTPMSAFEDPPSPVLSRNVIVVISVIAFHAFALWMLQTGLLRRAVEMIVPAQVLAEFIDPPRPQQDPPPPPPQPQQRTPTLAPAPQLAAIADTTASPNAPVGVIEPPQPLPPITAPVASAPPAPAAPPPAPPSPPRVELPSSDADYLQNPKPPYPPARLPGT